MRTGSRMVSGPALRAGLVILLVLVIGCQARNRAEDSASETKTAAAEKPAATATSSGAEKSGGEKHAAMAKTAMVTHTESEPAAPAGPSNHVYLSDRTCVWFEPHWASVHIGQPLTVTSHLKVPVTLHVMSGAFEKTAFVLKPGETVTTGPARDAGKFTMWTDPAACQEIPRGGEGAPGVIVEGAR